MSNSVRLYFQLIGRLKQLFTTLLYVSCSAATSSGWSNYHGSKEGRAEKYRKEQQSLQGVDQG